VFRFDLAADTETPIAGPGAPNFAGTGVDDGLAFPGGLAFDKDGNLLIADPGHNQVKRLGADKL
jgi:hypothetical protein